MLSEVNLEARAEFANSHFFGNSTGEVRCISCEVTPHNAWQFFCPAGTDAVRTYANLGKVAMGER